MRRIQCYGLTGFLSGLLFGTTFISEVQAANFSFTKIADSNDFSEFLVTHPSINDSGTVAFGITTGANGGIYRGDGKNLTTIATSNGQFDFSDSEASSSINNAGNVAFWTFRPGFVEQGIFIGNGSTVTTIADTNQFSGFGLEFYSLSINDLDTVAFSAFSLNGDRRGIYTSNGSSFTLIAEESNDLFFGVPDFLSPKISINNSGSVAFTALSADAKESIFVGNGGALQTIANTDGLFDYFASYESPAINDSGVVAFWAGLDSGESGIFTGNGVLTETIADSSGIFSYFGASAINNKNQVAFLAGLDSGGEGIFLGSDPINDKVIATGDSLLGSIVTSLNFSNEGLNNQGQLAFTAFLEDGRIVLVRTSSAPEPTTILGTIAIGLFGCRWMRRRKR